MKDIIVNKAFYYECHSDGTFKTPVQASRGKPVSFKMKCAAATAMWLSWCNFNRNSPSSPSDSESNGQVERRPAQGESTREYFHTALFERGDLKIGERNC